MCYKIILTSKTGKNEYGNYRKYENALNEMKELIETGHCGVNEEDKVVLSLKQIIFSDD